MRILMISILFSTHSMYVFAQLGKVFRGVDEVEILGGPSLSFLMGSTYVRKNELNDRFPKYSLTYGVGFTWEIKGNINLIAQLLVERKGTILEWPTTYFDEDSQTFRQGTVRENYEYAYVSFPFRVEYVLTRDKNFKIGSGFYVSYLQRQLIELKRSPQGSIVIEDQTNLNRPLDFGLILSSSYSIPITEKIFFKIVAMNLWGVANTRSDPDYGIVRTNNTSVLFGILIKR